MEAKKDLLENLLIDPYEELDLLMQNSLTQHSKVDLPDIITIHYSTGYEETFILEEEDFS